MTLQLSKPHRIFLTVLLTVFFATIFFTQKSQANIYSPEGIEVATTYYGGNYDNGWVIDNENQCDRIAAGEFTAKSLNARVASNCDDDTGLGNINDTPLHNRVSFAELSNNPSALDGSALGNLKSGTRLEIKYKGRCVIAEKLDIGTGGYGISGKKRALDLWWQTARSIGFTSGLDIMTVRYVDKSTPLTPLGTSVSCGTSQQKVAVAPTSTTKPVIINTAVPTPVPTLTLTPSPTNTPKPKKPKSTPTPTIIYTEEIYGEQDSRDDKILPSFLSKESPILIITGLAATLATILALLHMYKEHKTHSKHNRK